ncbi:MAG: O-antigen ligase family protein [Candidatus Yanofskybacteria bacterium]|nr:O-antigen ligase family protein [Candidatus Yanofskybacteria bacterium]
MSINKDPILAVILRYFIYAAAFVPLIIFNDYVSPFHFGKVIILRSLVEVMLVLFILLIWKDRSYMPKMNSVGWSFLLFAAVFSITTITSVIPYSSFWGSLERMGGVFTFWHYFIYFIILTAVFRKESDWINLFRLVMVVGVMSAFYGFGQRTNIAWIVGSGGRERIFGTIGNPALFAGYQILCAFLGLTLFFRKGNSMNWKLFYGIFSLITVIAVLMTAVRGSLVGVGVGFLSFALLYTAAYKSKKAKKILLGLITLAFLFIISALLLKNSSLVQGSGYLKRVTDFSLTSYTVQTRFWAWESGIKGWKETPKTIIFGWGPENFNIPFSKYFNPKFFGGPGSETLFDRAHNMFVEVLVTMGLLGLASYLYIFASSLRVLWKKIHDENMILYGVGLIPLLIAYAIHNSFIFDTSANFLVFFTILGFVSRLAQAKPFEVKAAETRPRKINEVAWSFSAIILFIFTGVMIYQVNILPAIANYATTRAIVAGWNKDFPGAIAKYKEVIEYDVPGKYEYRHRFAQYVLEQAQSKKLTPELTDIIWLAIGETKKNIQENPVDYLPYLYTARLYINLGKEDPKSEYNDISLEFSLKALDLAPTFIRTYYEVAQAYLNKKDYEKAIEYFKAAAELNPEAEVSYWYWGITEIERGNTNEGLAIVESIVRTGKYMASENDLRRLVNIYVKQNNLPGVVWVFELLVQISPSDPQYHASLASAYSQVGKIEEAVAEAKTAAKLDIKFEAEARMFVNNIGGQW